MDNSTSATSIQKKSQNTSGQLDVVKLESLTKQISIASSMISGKAPSPFCETFAEDLMNSFPHVELDQILKALERGVRGEFGPVYLLNGTVLYDWVKKHGRFKYDHARHKDGETYLDRFVRNKIDPRDTKEIEIFVAEENIIPSYVQVIQSHFRDNPELFPYVQN